MVCKNCGHTLLENEKFCTMCGNYVDEVSHTSQVKKNNIIISEEPPEMKNRDDYYDASSLVSINNNNDVTSPPPNNFSDINRRDSHPEIQMNENRYDRLLEAYIGEDYQEIVRKKINIYAFLFNLFYFLYRKMYIIGILGLIILWIIAIKHTIFIIPYIGVIALLSGVLFNPIYLKIADIKIKRIRKNNSSTDDFELMEVCRKKGGVNAVIALLIYLIFIVSIIGTLFSFKLFLNGKDKYWEENNNNRANCMYLTKNTLFYIKNNEIKGDVEESVCKKFGEDNKYFDIYIKMKRIDGSFSYLYFTTGDTEINLNNNTERKSTLESKAMNGTISEEEKKLLEDYELIESDYSKIKADSEKYEELLAAKKNKSERTSFVFTKEEIFR